MTRLTELEVAHRIIKVAGDRSFKLTLFDGKDHSTENVTWAEPGELWASFANDEDNPDDVQIGQVDTAKFDYEMMLGHLGGHYEKEE